MAKNEKTTQLQHIVIVPDGNRRWAKEHNVPESLGHRKGAENTQGVLNACKERNVKYVTLWGFSTENWHRSPEEVEYLMNLFAEFLRKEYATMIKNKVCFRHLGRKDRLSVGLMKEIASMEEATKDFTDWHLQIALDYGGKDEIVRATKKLLADVQAGKQKESDITEELFATYLDTVGIPDPDLIVRTSGEQRLSGLLPFQSVYSELVFVPYYFPDFTKEKVLEVIDQYSERQRRFGK